MSALRGLLGPTKTLAAPAPATPGPLDTPIPPRPAPRPTADDDHAGNPYGLDSPHDLVHSGLRWDRMSYWGKVAFFSSFTGGIGLNFGLMMDASVGEALFSVKPWLNALLSGGLAGAWAGYDTLSRDLRTDMTIDFEGRRRETSLYFGRLGHLERRVKKTTEEADALKATGPGDRIAFPRKATRREEGYELDDREVAFVKKLAANGRLVADFGETSECYGRPVLQRIDAVEAIARFSRGEPVRVIDGASQESDPRRLRISASKASLTESASMELRWVDLTYRFTTQSCRSLAELEAAHERCTGAPLPDELIGVYRDTSHYSECIALKSRSVSRAWHRDDEGWKEYRYDREKKRVIVRGSEPSLGDFDSLDLIAHRPAWWGFLAAGGLAQLFQGGVQSPLQALLVGAMLIGAKKLGDGMQRGR